MHLLNSIGTRVFSFRSTAAEPPYWGDIGGTVFAGVSARGEAVLRRVHDAQAAFYRRHSAAAGGAAAGGAAGAGGGGGGGDGGGAGAGAADADADAA